MSFMRKSEAFWREFDPSYSLQIRWSVGGNYDEDLLRYEKISPNSDPDSGWAGFSEMSASIIFVKSPERQFKKRSAGHISVS